MKSELLRFVRTHSLLHGGETVICALSGGADSMALLTALQQLRGELGITVRAAHFNHGLRGAESDADEAFVREFCAQNAIPLTVGHGSLPNASEDTAREARYAFLQSLGGTVATAHTADDNAETVLMNLLRGTGLRGLAGIPPKRGNIIRPLLGVTREQVIAFLTAHGIPWRTDSSNEGDAYRRNRLRHQVIPLLKAENPRFCETVLDESLRLRAEDAYLDECAAAALAAAEADGGWRCEPLCALPKAILRRALHRIAQPCGAQHTEALCELLFSASPARHSLPGGRTAAVSYGMLRISGESAPTGIPAETPLVPGEACIYGERCIHAFFTEDAAAFPQSADTFALNFDKLTAPITVRPRAEGDRLRTAAGHRTLKRLMIDRKIPAAQRAHLAVFAAGSQVVAAEGIGINRDFLPADGCRVLIIQIRNQT